MGHAVQPMQPWAFSPTYVGSDRTEPWPRCVLAPPRHRKGARPLCRSTSAPHFHPRHPRPPLVPLLQRKPPPPLSLTSLYHFSPSPPSPLLHHSSHLHASPRLHSPPRALHTPGPFPHSDFYRCMVRSLHTSSKDSVLAPHGYCPFAPAGPLQRVVPGG